MPTPPEVHLLPLSLPSDATEILRLHYQDYLSDPLHTKTTTTESEFISTGLSSIISRFSVPGNLTGKLVLATNPSKIVSYIVWNPPGTPDLRPEEEKNAELRAEIEKLSQGLDKELVYKLKIEDRALNERFFGRGYESRYWTLDALVTDEEFQRMGLGSRLVKWGLERVEEECRKTRGLGLENEVLGAYLIASPPGMKTYLNAGFEKMGERETQTKEEKYAHVWFLKKFN